MIWTLTYEKTPHFNNRWVKLSRPERTAIKNEWKDTFFWLAKQEHVPPLGPTEVWATVQRKNHKSMPDVDGAAPSVKHALDGIVAAGVWPDDNPLWVVSLKYTVEVTGLDALTIHLEGDPR